MSKNRKIIFIVIGLLVLATLMVPMAATIAAQPTQYAGNLIWSGGWLWSGTVAVAEFCCWAMSAFFMDAQYTTQSARSAWTWI